MSLTNHRGLLLTLEKALHSFDGIDIDSDIIKIKEDLDALKLSYGNGLTKEICFDKEKMAINMFLNGKPTIYIANMIDMSQASVHNFIYSYIKYHKKMLNDITSKYNFNSESKQDKKKYSGIEKYLKDALDKANSSLMIKNNSESFYNELKHKIEEADYLDQRQKTALLLNFNGKGKKQAVEEVKINHEKLENGIADFVDTEIVLINKIYQFLLDYNIKYYTKDDC